MSSFSQIDPLPNIKDVEVRDTIGQGSFAIVKKATLKNDDSLVFAIKFVHLHTCKKFGLDDNAIANEVLIHKKCSKHPNVIRLLNFSVSTNYLWLAMELAAGGDLFDKIEPDVGIPDQEVVQFYFQQLLNAVHYLHNECGVAHRDIKPENILLDNHGNMKLADFGLATVFKRQNGTYRNSIDVCGSPPYMAPDVLADGGYRSDVADIWSCGILLFVLLTGSTPWEEPSANDQWYVDFVENDGRILAGSWERLDIDTLSLIRGILKPKVSQRYSISKIQSHRWLQKKRVSFVDENYQCNNAEELFKRLTSNLKVSLSDDDYFRFNHDSLLMTQKTGDFDSENHYISNKITPLFSQQDEGFAVLKHDNLYKKYIPAATQNVCHPDPVINVSNFNDQKKWHMIMSQDPSSSQYKVSTEENFKPFSNNIYTRFYSVEDIEDILKVLENAIKTLNVSNCSSIVNEYANLIKLLGSAPIYPLSISIRTIDTRRLLLAGYLKIQQLDEDLKTVTFIRTKGDPLEWRRFFKKVTLLSREIVLQ
ncbi:related to Serine/threonine-protein kinase CHK1 [Saccharomycodes ludwigii]|uniref:non-specific serine/threonine protein kinase n=1 Tax=Saccharomycodes ludwigii TaxID=36035 RepID=A0A376B167_9ASCO|nr:hypothetical protein SCDLUD_003576 [Saccharomycodes ludwigii]KAH3900584.1 hypothetical protein SCDLUD_003576 [Saccharomycodes ludwigii]SSD58436.1 related to Serine/threonine-protein kinase CHK1 [Saccharomycodes ludwigii]